MKNISKYWLLFMIAAMSATSCSDDDNEKVVMPDPDPTTLGWEKKQMAAFSVDWALVLWLCIRTDNSERKNHK